MRETSVPRGRTSILLALALPAPVPARGLASAVKNDDQAGDRNRDMDDAAHA
jgi:hypothetical protein